MRGPLLFGAIIVGAGWVALTPAMATSIGSTGFNGLLPSATSVEKVGYWKRQYRRYGYPAPYAYYPPVYGHSPPPVVCLPTGCLWLPTGSARLRLYSARIWPGTSACC